MSSSDRKVSNEKGESNEYACAKKARVRVKISKLLALSSLLKIVEVDENEREREKG